MENIKIIAPVYKANAGETAKYYDDCGADELFFKDEQSFESERNIDIQTIKEITRNADIPLNVMADVHCFDDIKKMIYAGAKRIIIKNCSTLEEQVIKEAVNRFGDQRIYRYMEVDDIEQCLEEARDSLRQGFGGIALAGDYTEERYIMIADRIKAEHNIPVFIIADTTDSVILSDLLKMCMPQAVFLRMQERFDVMDLKQELKKEGLKTNTFTSSLSFDQFKLNSDGMIPVVTQDYKTGQVLMVAYMTKESYELTVQRGKMTYYSRSRNELWCKGDTSGHYQYVKSLSIDCDYDTILAKVAQVGAACHTGNYSCFFTDLVKKDHMAQNPLQVFEEVMDTIQQRKEHPKEGSYTNYLLQKGIDKILKKVGEEAAEIIISAKNPENDELKYEICDFLYHLMVLMAESDITWKEITEELMQRH